MDKKLLIKVCGMREGENIRKIESLGIDLIGFIFYSKSPRYVSVYPDYLPDRSKRVGVFVNAEFGYICEKADEYELAYIQLHGNESPEECEKLHEKGYRLIKAFSIERTEDLEKVRRYEGLCDYYLFDTKSVDYGGTGKTFDWKVLQHYEGNTPFLLSGGIGFDSGKALSDFHHERWSGIDLNSKFETAPGVKDDRLLQDFLKRLFVI